MNLERFFNKNRHILLLISTANIYNRVLNQQKQDAMKALDQFSQKMDYEKNEKKRENKWPAKKNC